MRQADQGVREAWVLGGKVCMRYLVREFQLSVCIWALIFRKVLELDS